MKTHLSLLTNTTACGRGKVITHKSSQVTCILCKNTDHYAEVKFNDDQAKRAAFEAQPPRTLREPWHEEAVNIKCRECSTELFRIGDRTCMGHYQDYVCINGHTESRLTETGMSF